MYVTHDSQYQGSLRSGAGEARCDGCEAEDGVVGEVYFDRAGGTGVVMDVDVHGGASWVGVYPPPAARGYGAITVRGGGSLEWAPSVRVFRI